MLKTVLDYGIFEHFTLNQPRPVPIGSELDNKAWLSMWEFLKSGSNVSITNYLNEQNLFLNSLTTGRKGTTCKLDSNFNKPHKCKFPKSQPVNSFFLLDVPSENEQIKYRKNNGFLFGFKGDYTQVWKDLALLEKPEVLPVREKAEIKFHSWKQLADYVLPFTDLIIVDNYMFDESIWHYNLFRIIEEFSFKTPVKFNLLLLSYFHDKELVNIVELNNTVTQILAEKRIRCDLSIVLANQAIKEHDRGIFSNYLRIKSGDSFSFFGKSGEMKTKGTDIDFHTMIKVDKVNASDAALVNISDIIEKLNTRLLKEKRMIGNLKNNLLNLTRVCLETI
jgi:hypothetical protein